MTPTRKLALTSGLFALALVLVALAAATHSVAPLFVAWVPLALIGFWVLPRPGSDWQRAVAGSASPAQGETIMGDPEERAEAEETPES
ncbi:MAG TPA: hypothetical protein VF660_03970 [Actinomycetota bacterium]|jgi:hypothetical protein